MLKRIKENKIKESLQHFKVVAILGERQVGKSTLARKISKHFDVETIFLDLERPSDLVKLDDAESFFSSHKNSLICLDEIQLKPNLFPLLRFLVDQNDRKAQFLILGSASPELLRQSSETLAGRIFYYEISPFNILEIEYDRLKHLWLVGGYPESFLQHGQQSFDWRLAYIRTFLERDLAMLGFQRSATQMRRFWTMLAHLHGEELRQEKIAQSLDVSSPTVKSFINMMNDTFMVRVLPPYFTNTKKRLIKSPRIYIRDSGLLHTLLNIEDFDALLSHPIYGKSFEGFVIEQILNSISDRWQASFFRSATGDECDLVLQKGLIKVAIEIKASSAPNLTDGNKRAFSFLEADHNFVVGLIEKSYQMTDNIEVCNLIEVIEKIQDLK